MKSLRVVLLAVAVALLVAPAAHAKGPSKAEVRGPGLDKAIVFRGGEDFGTPLGDFVQSVGFFPSVFTQTPDPMQRSHPAGALGPKYTVTYTVPGPNGERFILRQAIYPYAKPTPVSYMAPGQRIFEGMKTRGGWYVSDSSLRATLVRAGLPSRAPSTRSGASLGLFAGIGIPGLLLLAAAAILVARRRGRPSTT